MTNNTYCVERPQNIQIMSLIVLKLENLTSSAVMQRKIYKKWLKIKISNKLNVFFFLRMCLMLEDVYKERLKAHNIFYII